MARFVDDDEAGGEEVVAGADLADEAEVCGLGGGFDGEQAADDGVAGGRFADRVHLVRGDGGDSTLAEDFDLGVAVALVRALELHRVLAQAGGHEVPGQSVCVEADRFVLEAESRVQDRDVGLLVLRQRFGTAFEEMEDGH